MTVEAWILDVVMMETGFGGLMRKRMRYDTLLEYTHSYY